MTKYFTGSPIGGHVLDPFVESEISIFAAMAHDRNLVGIDMRPDYVDYIRSALEADGHKAVNWDYLQERLTQPSMMWNSWAGNRLNFRKPGCEDAE